MSSTQAAKDATESLDTGVTGFGIAYALTSVLSALLVVLKESNVPVHDALTTMTGHHWVSHGVLNLIVFLGLGFVLTRLGGGIRMTENRLLALIVAATGLGGLIIVGYFI